MIQLVDGYCINTHSEVEHAQVKLEFFNKEHLMQLCTTYRTFSEGVEHHFVLGGFVSFGDFINKREGVTYFLAEFE